MCFSKLIPLCLLLLLSLLLQAAIGADPLFHFCFILENYTSNDPFNSNLNELTTLLSSKVPPTGFRFASTGLGQDNVYGLALYRGDISSTNCKTCVTKATKELRNWCPYNKGVIIWYYNCLFKYSNVKFFGEIDNKNKFHMYNVQSADDPTSFNVKTKELSSSLSNKAYGSPVLFATGELVLEESMKLYGLAQCTRNLSSLDCKKCLDGAVSELPSCCDGKRGGRVVGGSCNVRYELYPFVNA
ncbi:cysteine-rich repeat secretory protein 38-like [Vitis riparia]|uniref:cysteine-rich repeat secretory protein 38-like n=1 Tax=Vitis riparia TaxID=96939 RepID=UPI00155A683F|nr:cysteine-rich repeat secretory protein 38-like [Vitis riparia]